MLAIVVGGSRATSVIPPPLPDQARLAAHDEIPLDIVLRRCVAGFTGLSDFALQEAAGYEDGLENSTHLCKGTRRPSPHEAG